MKVTRKANDSGLKFSELVYRYNQRPSENLEAKILDILIPRAEGVVNTNDLLNKFGELNVKQITQVHPAVTICKALTILANYDYFKCSIYTRNKEYYKSEIFDAIRTYGRGCNRQETYKRFKAFVY